jgi:catechol 2,3-dioxygenase-like lactoylglutathione lyase family enzyme
VLAHFIVSDDVERSRRFYTEVLGGRVAFSGPGGLTYVALANTWIIINVGGGPTDDKPAVTLETPRDPDRVSSFLNIRVKDIQAVYAEWSARGAQFLTPPKKHQYETRCYIRDPDGYLIEVGQTTDPDGDWSPAHWPSSTSLFRGTSRRRYAGIRERTPICRITRFAFPLATASGRGQFTGQQSAGALGGDALHGAGEGDDLRPYGLREPAEGQRRHRQVLHGDGDHLPRQAVRVDRADDGDEPTECDPVEDLVQAHRRALLLIGQFLAEFAGGHRRTVRETVVAR